MRKVLKIFGVLLLLGCVVRVFDKCSCSSSGGTVVKDKDGKEVTVYIGDPKSYVDAVKDQDFVLAHNILDELYAEYLAEYNKSKHFSMHYDQKFWTAANYIYNAEMDYLLPQNDAEANRRVVFTLVQINPIGDEPIDGHTYSGYDDNMGRYDAYVNFVAEYNKLCSKIIELALFYHNSDVATQVLKEIKVGYTCNRDDDSNYTWTSNTVDKERAAKLMTKHQ
jgi:hypothetical protein